MDLVIRCSAAADFFGVAFSGYTLIWGQMSYWGVVVIISMVTVFRGLGRIS